MFIPKALRPGSSGGHIGKAIGGGERTAVLTRYPRHELQGPQNTHGPERPQVHVCVEVGSCGGQDAADGDTEGPGYHGLVSPPVPGRISLESTHTLNASCVWVHLS